MKKIVKVIDFLIEKVFAVVVPSLLLFYAIVLTSRFEEDPLSFLLAFFCVFMTIRYIKEN